MRTLILSLAALFLTKSVMAASWESYRATDPMHDTELVVGVIKQRGDQSILVQCEDGQAIFGLISLSYIELVETGEPLAYRVDKREPVVIEVVRVQRRNDTFAAIDNNDARAFAEAIKTAKDRVVIERGNNRGIFPVVGSTKAMTAVLDACQG